MEKYISVTESEEFKKELYSLNKCISDTLNSKNYEAVLIGNLFYDHLQRNFVNSPPNKILDEKRKRLFDVASKSSVVFEVGVNGGHSAFLMLKSNTNLQYIGNDIAEFYSPEPLCHPEVYVPVAIDYLSKTFKDKITFLKGDSMSVIPNYVLNNKSKGRFIDCLHLDGAKWTYEHDFHCILPLLKPNAYVIIDDTNQEGVQRLVNKLLSSGTLVRSEYPQMDTSHVYRHEVLRVPNMSH